MVLYEETLRIQREEGQYAQRKQTEMANFAAFQLEKQAEVGIAGAEALGKMGANSGGSVDLGGGSSFNPAAMMAGIAVGGAVGQNVDGMMGNMMASVNQQPVPGTVPPPIPTIMYHVAVNGQAVGPFDIQVLKQMAANGTLTKETLVWKQGMENWLAVSMINELQQIFESTVPPIPSDKAE